MSEVFYKVLWMIKVCYKSETPCQAEPRDLLKRPNHANTMKISSHFFSSDHGDGIPAIAVVLATPVP